jgi:Zn-dependent protease
VDHDHWRLGKWRGIPIVMHWSVLLVFAWLYLIFWDFLATAIASVTLLALFLAHEFGHVAIIRWRKIPVASITLNGIHGETAYGFARPQDEALVAWGGVAAQLVVLILALLVSALVDFSAVPYASLVAGPVLLVLTRLNIFLIIVALLPIGPFDGRKAWAGLPMLRSSIRRRIRAARTRKLSPEQKEELEAKSQKAASDLMEKLRKSTKEDA